MGASGRNGGQLIRGIGHDVSGFAKYVGEEGVRYLERAGIDSVTLVGERVRTQGIDCDLRWGFCELANTAAQFAAFKGEQERLSAQGYNHEVRVVGPQDMHQVVGSQVYAGGLVDMGSGHLHPLNLVLGEARVAESLGVRISSTPQRWNCSTATPCRYAAPAARCVPATWCWPAMPTWRRWSRA